MFKLLFGRPHVLERRQEAIVSRDVDRLIADMGERAAVVAGEMSFREDAGLLNSPRPGHWHRVQAEIERILAAPDQTAGKPLRAPGRPVGPADTA